MALFGIIGYPLGHSRSAELFNARFAEAGLNGYEYRNFPLERIDDLPALLRAHPDLRGFSVTIPWKERIIPLLDDLSPEARAIGAVNCVTVNDGKLRGHNTDWYGFSATLKDFLGGKGLGATLHALHALVLGSGGAAKAVTYSLDHIGIAHTTVSRSRTGDGYITWDEVTPEVVAAHRLIVNATPLGTFPAVGDAPPLPYGAISSAHYLYDLVYNPPLTRFLASGAAQGAATLSGLPMLLAQAEIAWEIFGLPPTVSSK